MIAHRDLPALDGVSGHVVGLDSIAYHYLDSYRTAIIPSVGVVNQRLHPAGKSSDLKRRAGPCSFWLRQKRQSKNLCQKKEAI